jgi:ElaB/YqjD/DUF883 family membrane-anchored ribosome-binding protein
MANPNPRESASQTFKSVERNIADVAADKKDDLIEAAGQAGRKVRNMVDNAGDEISHAAERVTAQIRENPIQSGLVALFAGVVIGMLLRRS